ncbi:DUF6262 family protein [Rhodococcus sp. NPDC060176]|uniref:DUF6262 family protein n=1 Tax=Rhodococcus sp. NPDC060176 TaxID=3347062 RepID=UPI003662E0B5
MSCPNNRTAAARARHTETRARAEAALLALSNAGEPVTFAAVARRARVSTDFLYNQPDLRTKINDLHTRRSHRRTTPEQITDNRTRTAVCIIRGQSTVRAA